MWASSFQMNNCYGCSKVNVAPILRAEDKILQRRFSAATWTSAEIPGSSSHYPSITDLLTQTTSWVPRIQR